MSHCDTYRSFWLSRILIGWWPRAPAVQGISYHAADVRLNSDEPHSINDSSFRDSGALLTEAYCSRRALAKLPTLTLTL